MNSLPWLTAAIVLPLVGALAVMAVPQQRRSGKDLPQKVALGFSLATAALVVAMATGYEPGAGGYQFEELHPWIPAFGANYSLGVDGLGLTLILLTVILSPVVIGASWRDADQGRWSVNSFFAWMLVLEGLAIGAFAATDVFLFYVLFEATLFPIYFLIGGFGGIKRQYAAVKFLVVSLLGGLVMLAGVIGIYVQTMDAPGGPTYLLADLGPLLADIDTFAGRWIFVAFFIAFAFKAPMVPVHTWLPDAVDEATPGTSVLLVSVLDKIGTFGMLRFCLGLFPEASNWATPVVLILALVSILYGGLVAINQRTIPRLIAYTSVSHFGFIVLGIFVMNSQGQTGSILYMFNHGLSTGVLFLVGGFLIARAGTKNIADMGGIQKVAPILAGVMLIGGLSSLSLPGLSPFVSEFLVMTGAFVKSYWYAVFAVPGIVLAALYITLLYQRTMTGPLKPAFVAMPDLGPREIVAVAPLVVLIVGLGFYPQPLVNVIEPSVETTLVGVGATETGPTVTEPAAEESAE